MSMDFGDAMLRDAERRLEWQLQQAEELQTRVEATSVTVESRGGEATVTVNSSGGLSDLTLTDRAMRLRPDELAAIILGTSRQAQAQLTQRMGELVGSLYGEGSATAEFVSGVYAEQYPPQPEDDSDRDERNRRPA